MGKFFGSEGKIERLSGGGYSVEEMSEELGVSEDEIRRMLNDPCRERYEYYEED